MLRAVARLLYQGGQAVDKGAKQNFQNIFSLVENNLK